MTNKRPNPENLLRRVQDAESKEHRGKFKIYLGAAPGVGKTHKMLDDAFSKYAQGLDVVVGVVESHGRKEIESVLKVFEILPRLGVEYHGKQLLEFDLDAALQRNPGLILIDEMAHTNVPGLRHTKRWQDIKELLDRGIDVYTTLNVQHIESLNDNVSQIINAPVKETVPDLMIDIADTIELVDLPPEELIKRLHEGKVYIPEQAELAVENFFRKGNLIALRELALRATAEHVGAEVLLYRQGHGITQIWPTKEKILVCVGPGPESPKLIRAARRMATSLQTEWIAVYVNTPRLQSSEERRNLVIKHLSLAEQLGAETRILSGFDIVKEIMSFAREQNVTLIMVWKYIRKRWRDLVFRNLVDEVVRNSGEIDIYIMTGTVNAAKTTEIQTPKKQIPWKFYGISTGIISIATILDFLLFPFFATSNLIMVYLLAVTVVALLGEIGPSILASVLSIVAYDFFFIPPFYTFSVSDIEYAFTLIVMLVVTQVISHLTILTRRQAKSARMAERDISALYKLSRQLAVTRGIDELLDVGVQYIAQTFDTKVVALLPDNGRLVIQLKNKKHEHLDVKERSIAQWAYDLGQAAGIGTDILSLSTALYIPLLGTRGTIGVLQIQPVQTKLLFTPEQRRLFEACANQIALAIEVDQANEPTP